MKSGTFFMLLIVLYGCIIHPMNFLDMPKDIIMQIVAYCEPRDRNRLQYVSRYTRECADKKNKDILFHSPLILGKKDKAFFMAYYCDEGNLQIVQNLLNNGVSPDEKNELGVAPISLVLQNKHFALEELLLNAGAKGQVFDAVSPFFVAVYKGDIKLVKKYLKHRHIGRVSFGANGYPVLHLATIGGHTDVVSFLLSRLNPARIADKDTTEKTPLHHAAKLGYAQIGQLLIDCKGINVDEKDKHETTALHWAVVRGQVDIVRLLLGHKADINAKNNNGNVPLHYAGYSCAKLFFDYGAQINIKNLKGETPLHKVIECKRHVTTIGLFLDRGVCINEKDNEDKTPLHFAVIHKRPDIAKLLLERGAKTDIKDKSGKTALMYVCENGSDECAELLDYCKDFALNYNDIECIELPYILPNWLAWLLNNFFYASHYIV